MITLGGLSTPATAQQATPPAAASEETDKDDIVVTARRREENVQSVPTAISVFSGARLQQLGVTRVEDLKNVTAGLNVQGGAGREDNPIYLIRGQRATDTILTQDGPVASYVDDVLIGATPGSNAGLFDLASVQVLKGPQGTLFGRNTTGGAILYSTAKPTAEFEGGVTVGLGNFSQKHVDAFINVPVSTTFRLRAAMQYEHHAGFSKIVKGPRNGQTLNDRDELSGRVIAEFDPTQNVKSTTVLYASRSDSTGPGFIFEGYSPVSSAAFVPGIAAELAAQQSRADRETGSEFPNTGTRSRIWGTNNTTTVELSENVTFKNIIGYRHLDYGARDDFDGTPLVILSTDNTENARQFTEEAQILGKAFDNNVDYVLGIYYFDMRGIDTANENHALEAINPGSPSFVGGQYDNKSFSGYGQFTWKTPVEGLSFTGGLRYTADNRSITLTPQILPSASGGAKCNLSAPGVVYTLANCSRSAAASFTSPTWTFSLDYKLDPDTLLYIAHRHGYRSGGFNVRAQTDTQFTPYKPEYVNDLEVGLKKTTMVGGWKVRTNLAGYYQWYSDIQRNANVITNGTLQSVIINAASATIYGGEAEISIEPTKHFRVGANYSYSRPKYTAYNVIDSFNGVPAQTVDHSNRAFTFVPRHQLNANLQYEYPLTSKSSLNFTANFSYQSSEIFAEQYQSVAQLRQLYAPAVAATIPDNLAGFGQGGFGLLGLRLDWTNVGDTPITLSLIGKNVTNRRYFSSALTLYDTLGTAVTVPGDPRTVMGQVSVKF
jgi:iron complex outermembrane receptor protein